MNDIEQLNTELSKEFAQLNNTIYILVYAFVIAIIIFVISITVTLIIMCKMEEKSKERDDKMVNLLSYDSLKTTYEGTEKNII